MAASSSNTHGLQRLASTDSNPPVNPKSPIHELTLETSPASSGSDGLRQPDEPLLSSGYRVYRRRFFGLAQLVLLNIVISWGWLTFAAVSQTTADFFNVTESAVNWLSTSVLFAFAISAPLTIWVLNHYGPKGSMLVASGLTLVGNWARYAGTRAGKGNFGAVMFGQILIGLAQPFALAAPTRYSNTWFSDSGRITATAVASLANPLGAALGQLIGPFWATDVSGIPNMVLYTALISTIASLPAPFIPAHPPSPPSATAALATLDLRQALHSLPRNGSFYLILVPFAIYVAAFNATSSLINQILSPYAFSETDAGLAGGILILAGLLASAIASPILDRKRAYLLPLKLLVPGIAAAYLVLVFVPATRSLPAVYVVAAALGATSFILLPLALELLALLTLPVSPEVSSVVAWTAGQVLGAVFILVMDALEAPAGWEGEPPGTLKRGLVFQAVVACVAVPFALLLGTGRFRRITVGAGGVVVVRGAAGTVE